MKFGNPKDQIPGKNIILPEHPKFIQAVDLDLVKIKKSLIKNSVNNYELSTLTKDDIEFLIIETNSDEAFVKSVLDELKITY